MIRPSEPTAVFGGSFDPVHRGHIEIARRLVEDGFYRSVIWIPAARNPLKPSGPAAANQDRLEMLRLATASFSWSIVSDLEIRRGGVSYTVETLEALRAEYELTVRPGLVLGEDAFLSLPKWHRVHDLVRACCFAVFPRASFAGGPANGGSAVESVEIESWLLKSGGCLQRIQMDPVPVSSTDIRRRIGSGYSCMHVLPPAVAEYIANRGLYVSADL